MLNHQQRAANLHRDARSVAELTPWLYPYNDRIVVNKDTGLMACFRFEGLDPDGATVEQLNSQAGIADFAAKIFAEKPITQWWKVDRRRTRYYPGGTFPDEISQSIDDARRRSFEAGNNRINTHTLTIVMLPEVGRDRFISRIRRLMMLDEGLSYWRAVLEALKSFTADNTALAYTDDELVAAADRFEELLSSFAGAFSNKVRFARMTGERLAAFLRSTISVHEQELVALPSGWFLDSYLPDTYLIPGHNFIEMTGSATQFAKVITIKSFPQPENDDTTGYTEPGQLDKLLQVNGDISFTQVYRYAPKAKALSFMNSVKRFNDVAQYGWKGFVAGAFSGSMKDAKVNQGRSKDLQQTEQAIGKLTIDQGTSGWYNCTVVCYGDTLEDADDLAKDVESIVRSAKFIPIQETQHTLSAWSGTIPGQWGEIVRWLFLDSPNLANLMPLRTISCGQIRNEFLTEKLGMDCPPLAVMSTDYGTPFYYVHYVMHVGHKMFMGGSRTGKTTFANFLWTMFRKYRNSRVITLDIDYSTRIPILLQGGKYIDFSDDTDARPKSNPLALIGEARHMGYLVRFVKLLCEMRGHRVTAQQETEIETALASVRTLDKDRHRLLTIYAQITDPVLRQQLEPWVGDHPYARYFDNTEDDLDLTNLVGMECRTILKDEVVAVPFMDLIFYRIQAQMTDERTQGLIVPTVIYVPEVWYFLKNPTFADQLQNYLKTFARYLASLWMDTQSPDELLQSRIFGTLRDNIKTVVFTPNSKALSDSLYNIYASEFVLSDSQIRRIAEGEGQRDYFIQQDGLSRMVRPWFDRETVARLGSDQRAQVTFNRHYQGGNPSHPNWKQNYVNDMLTTVSGKG